MIYDEHTPPTDPVLRRAWKHARWAQHYAATREQIEIAMRPHSVRGFWRTLYEQIEEWLGARHKGCGGVIYRVNEGRMSYERCARCHRSHPRQQ